MKSKTTYSPYDGHRQNNLRVTLRLLLVRHGLSSFNSEQRIQGRNDLSRLTTEGEEQALRTGEALADLQINAVYSSPLERAAKTATILTKQIKQNHSLIIDQGLLEIDLGPWSGLTAEEIKEKFPSDYNTWKKQPNKLVLKHEDGSNYYPIEELIKQAKEFLDKILQQHSPEMDKNVVIVGHNAILRCLILLLVGEPDNGFRRIRLDNASISVLNLSPHQSKLCTTQIECLNNTSHLTTSLPSKGTNARLILVRHGETDWNLQERFQGQIDIPLNNNGENQAKSTMSFLKKVKLDKAFSSPLSRPMQTAKEILTSHPEINIQAKKGLLEIGHGLWEGKLESEIKSNWPELLQEWKDSPEKVQMPEGESIQDVWTRSVKCWAMIANELNPNETALVVAHDAVNKTILCHLLGLTPADIWMVKQGNGGVTIVDISNDPSQPDVVTCLNLTSHLGGVLDSTAAGAL